MAYRDLITFDDLHGANMSEATIANLLEENVQAKTLIRQVTRLIEAHLGMTGRDTGLIVRRHTQAIERYDWAESKALGLHVAWADQQPVVEVMAGSDDLAGVSTPRTSDRKLARDTPRAGTITYFGGFRRPDQVLSGPDGREAELPTGTDEALDGLTTLPPTLPDQVQTAAVNVTLHVLQGRAEGKLGRRVQQRFGDQQVTIEGADPQYVSRQLRSLNTVSTRRLVA